MRASSAPPAPGTRGASAVADDPYGSLKARLDEVHRWPCVYTFKFIMKKERLEGFVPIFEGHRYTTRDSAAGRHVAVTAELFVETSDEVIAIYRAAAKHEGVIPL